METEGLIITPQPTEEKTPVVQKKRKTSIRVRTKGLWDAPGASRRLKELWADPVWREEQLKRHAAGQAKRADRGPNKVHGDRLGVPDGMRKPEAMKLWAAARESAKKTMSELEKAGVVTSEDGDKAKEALQEAIAVMRSPQNQTIKLAAAKLVLEYTKSKPASKSEISVNKAEEWLKAVAEENDERETATDTEETS